MNIGSLLKCHDDHPDCFAYDITAGKCMALESYMREERNKDGELVHRRVFGTKFKAGCPFYKTIEQAGGTYEMLAEKYPVGQDLHDPKILEAENLWEIMTT